MTPINPLKLILASRSPRRRELLQKAGFHFEVIPSRIDEEIPPGSTPEEFVKTLAKAKAQDIASENGDAVVLGADTIVVLGNTILGKPSDKDHARWMLQQLSGVWHQVMTGYTLIHVNAAKTMSAVHSTDVKFKILTLAEIEWYIKSAEPEDKAGAYAIQGIGALWVEKIRGSYTNVVGLPICEVAQALIRMGVRHPTTTTISSDSL